MAKFYGSIGFQVTTETSPGIYEEEITEHFYYGDVIKNSRKLQEAGKINDDVNVSNRISIIADAFATTNIYAMRYVTMMGTRWKVKDVEVEHPRLILTLGGIYSE